MARYELRSSYDSWKRKSGTNSFDGDGSCTVFLDQGECVKVYDNDCNAYIEPWRMINNIPDTMMTVDTGCGSRNFCPIFAGVFRFTSCSVDEPD